MLKSFRKLECHNETQTLKIRSHTCKIRLTFCQEVVYYSKMTYQSFLESKSSIRFFDWSEVKCPHAMSSVTMFHKHFWKLKIHFGLTSRRRNETKSTICKQITLRTRITFQTFTKILSKLTSQLCWKPTDRRSRWKVACEVVRLTYIFEIFFWPLDLESRDKTVFSLWNLSNN